MRTNTTRAALFEAFETEVRPTLEAAAEVLRDQGLGADADALLDAQAMREAVDACLSVREAIHAHATLRNTLRSIRRTA